MAPVVSATALGKNYGRTQALSGLDLQVGEGTLFGLLGPNGAGKSTAFGILCGWLQPSAGFASILGLPCNELHRLGGRVAALPQDTTFPQRLRVIDELSHLATLLGMSKGAARRDAERVLDITDLADKARAKASELSHGMGKRLGLAQALLGEPEVVMLDEPTAGLDPKNARAVKDMLLELVPQTTVIVSSHNLAEIQELCSHAAILDKGRTRFNGPLDELTRKSGQFVVHLADDSGVDTAALAALAPVSEARLDGALLEVRFSAESAPSEVLRVTLEWLFAHDVPVLEVRRGTSLEGAFLELTATP